MPTSHTLADAIRAIRALSDLHSTHSTLDEDYALGAFQKGRGAFWTTAGYGNQVAGNFLTTANSEGLDAALARHAQDFPSDYRRGAPYLLGTLIPLNLQAHVDINRAWARLGGEIESTSRARAEKPVPMFEAAE